LTAEDARPVFDTIEEILCSVDHMQELQKPDILTQITDVPFVYELEPEERYRVAHYIINK
jgi:hypothetical protein